MAMWLGNATDGYWGKRFIILGAAYIIGLLIGIYFLPILYINTFYTAQITGVTLAVAVIIISLGREKRINKF